MAHYYFAKESGRASEIRWAMNTVATPPGTGDYGWSDIVADTETIKAAAPHNCDVKLDVALSAMTTAGAGYPPGALNIVGGDGGWFPMHASDWFAACSASAADLRNTKTVDDVVGTLVPVVFPKSRQFTGM